MQEMWSRALTASAGKRGFCFSGVFVLEVLGSVWLESRERRWGCSSSDLSPVSWKAAWGKCRLFCKCFLLSVYPAGDRRWHRLLAEQRSLLCNEGERNRGWARAKNNWIHCYSGHRRWRKTWLLWGSLFCRKFDAFQATDRKDIKIWRQMLHWKSLWNLFGGRKFDRALRANSMWWYCWAATEKLYLCSVVLII